MSGMNKRNLVYFENPSMRGLYACMEEWQQANNRRLLSISVQQDGGNYCCIALTNPTEVVITSMDGNKSVDVYVPPDRAPYAGYLDVWDNRPR